MKQKRSFLTSFLIGFVILVGLDQWTKGMAVKHLMNQKPFVLWDGVFELLYSENRGAAFGMMQGRQFFFFVIALVVLGAVIYFLWRMPVTQRYMPMAVCLMMVSAGAVGNMIDRVLQGYVVDFLYFKLIDFPIFNVADCYVTVSAFLLILLVFFYYSEEEMEVFSPRKKEEKSA